MSEAVLDGMFMFEPVLVTIFKAFWASIYPGFSQGR